MSAEENTLTKRLGPGPDSVRAEAALRERISRLESVIDGSHVGTWEWNVQTGQADINERWAEMLGYSLAELRPLDIGAWRRLMHPDDLKASNQQLELHFAGQLAQYDCECRMRHEDGHWVWVQSRGRISSRTVDGRPLMMSGIQSDISARKQAEAAAQQAQQQREIAQRRHAELIATVDGIVWEADAQTFRFSFVSTQAERILGYPVSRWLNEPTFWADRIHPDDLQFAVSYCVACTQEMRDHSFDYRMRAADGHYVWLQDVVTVLAEDGRPKQLRGIMVDITARKNVENALRESEERLRLAVQASRVGLWDWDLETNRVRYSREWKAQLGYEEHEISDDFNEWQSRVHPDEVASALEEVQRYLAAPVGGLESELRMRHKDGSWRWIYTRAELIRDTATGRPLRFLGCHLDVTERRLLEEQLRHSQRMDAIGQLAGGVAHDFNNLLTVIQGNASMLQDDAEPLTAQQDEAVSELLRATERAAALTRQLLTFSRRQRIEARPLDLNAVVRDLFSMLQHLLGEDVRLELALEPAALGVVADPGLLEQALVNLAVNARDAMPGGGQLLVETRRVELLAGDPDLAADARPGLHARLRVADTGCGIAPEHLPHIFEPFFTTKEVGKGTGLGLAMVFGIVRQHGGWLRVTSQVGSGSRFSVFLPAVQSHAAGSELSPPTGAATPSPARGGTEAILLVEDEEPVRRLVQRVLSQAGYRVLTAESGRDALQLVEQGGLDVDLVLTDLIMPGGISGHDLGRRLRLRRPDQRLLYMSGYPRDGTARDDPELRQHAPTPTLAKPFTPASLLDSVRACLEAR